MKLNKFGRLEPKTWEHVDKYPFSILGLDPVSHVEKVLILPDGVSEYYIQKHNSCCGHAASICMSIHNRKIYNALWLYYEACRTDHDSNTTPQADIGTYLNATLNVLRKRGHRPRNRILSYWYEGIYSYYWAQTVNEMRKAISVNRPVILGIQWYTNFMVPQLYNGEYWIGRNDPGYVFGGHAICCYGASDKRQAFKLCNSWDDYPPVWIPYSMVQRLLMEAGEAGVPLDIKSRQKR